jgi:hypothetical protein
VDVSGGDARRLAPYAASFEPMVPVLSRKLPEHWVTAPLHPPAATTCSRRSAENGLAMIYLKEGCLRNRSLRKSNVIPPGGEPL